MIFKTKNSKPENSPTQTADPGSSENTEQAKTKQNKTVPRHIIFQTTECQRKVKNLKETKGKLPK